MQEFFLNSKEDQSGLINLDEIVKSLIKIKICPYKISKATLRYYYCY